MHAPLYFQIHSITRLDPARIRRAKGGIVQEMVIVDGEQTVSQDVFALHTHWRDWSRQFPKKSCDHVAFLYPWMEGLRQGILSRFQETFHYETGRDSPRCSSLELLNSYNRN
jgi:hypothetical protein